MPAETATFTLFLSKFVASVAMHLNIYHLYSNSMAIMKYVNNHPYKFDQETIAFILGFVMLVFSMIFESINIVMMFSRKDVYKTIGTYFTLKVLIKI